MEKRKKKVSSNPIYEKLCDRTLRVYLVSEFKLTFSYFKQHYTFFHTLFHPHVFQKTPNNNSQTTLPNTP